MFQLYRITGRQTPHVYYGYCPIEQDPSVAFAAQANRHDLGERGAKMLVVDNNNEIDTLESEQLNVYDYELDAFLARNEERARDPLAITGPSLFPASVYDRAAKEQPERVKHIASTMKARNCSTAREAYALGAFAFAHIKELSAEHGKGIIVADLDKMSPTRFADKYNLKFEV